MFWIFFFRGCFLIDYFLYRYERILNEMLSHLERQSRNKDRYTAWLQHIEPLFSCLGLVLLAHFRRIFPLFFQWMHSDNDQTLILVKVAESMSIRSDDFFVLFILLA